MPPVATSLRQHGRRHVTRRQGLTLKAGAGDITFNDTAGEANKSAAVQLGAVTATRSTISPRSAQLRPERQCFNAASLSLTGGTGDVFHAGRHPHEARTDNQTAALTSGSVTIATAGNVTIGAAATDFSAATGIVTRGTDATTAGAVAGSGGNVTITGANVVLSDVVDARGGDSPSARPARAASSRSPRTPARSHARGLVGARGGDAIGTSGDGGAAGANYRQGGGGDPVGSIDLAGGVEARGGDTASASNTASAGAGAAIQLLAFGGAIDMDGLNPPAVNSSRGGMPGRGPAAPAPPSDIEALQGAVSILGTLVTKRRHRQAGCQRQRGP